MQDFSCPSCGKVAFPSFVLGPANKLIVECAFCLHRDATLSPADFNKGIAAIGEGTGLGWAGKEKQVVETTSILPLAVARAATPVTFVPPSARAPGDVISWIEERASWLGAEEARIEGELASLKSQLAGVRAERRRLGKMLRVGSKSSEVDSVQV